VLVTTEVLQANCLGYNSRVAVVVNALDERLLVRRRWPQDRRMFPARRKVIGYMGTFSHDADILLISEALERVCARRDDTDIQIIGAIGDVRTFERLARLPVRVVPVATREVEYPLFMLWLTSRVWWDIGIAPLRDTAFNRCKSDLKLLDYSAMGAAGVFSRVGPYLASVSHQQTGWLAGDDVQQWVEALETLLEEDLWRVEMAANAQRYLYSQRTLKHCAPEWSRALDHLLQS
jgi:glycosyltransferase involved in cell wall biosynthesis